MSNLTEVANWRAPLLKLTQIGNPDHDGGKPTTIYIDPSCISYIRRTRGSFVKVASRGGQPPYEEHERIDCTAVSLHGNNEMLVIETPEVIAAARDRAYGHNHGPRAA